MRKYLIIFIACLVIGSVPMVALAGNTGFDYLHLNEQAAGVDTPPAGKAALNANAAGTALTLTNDAGATVTLGAGSGDNTLDNAYDQGGAGAGKKVEVDSGAIELEVDDTKNNPALHLDCNNTTNDPTALLIENAADAANSITIDIDAQSTGRDIEGSGATWYVTGAGAAQFAVLTATSFTPATLTVSGAGSFGGNVTLDDGVTDSPSVVLTDATNESLTITKIDSGYANMVTAAADGVRVTVGNLAVGNPATAGTASMDGLDAFFEGEVEIDGAFQCDGAATLAAGLTVTTVTSTGAVALSENVTFTMAADEYLLMDAATTPMTQTAGALDINVIAGATDVVALLLDFEVENTFANGYGIYINADDDATGGEETFDAIYIENDAGTASTVNGLTTANTLDVGFNSVVGAATKAINIDAATTDHTGTAGAIDISMDTITSTACAINVDLEMLAGGGADEVAAMVIDLVDSSDAAGEIAGIVLDSSTPGGSSRVIGISFTDQAGAATGLTECIAAEIPAAGQYLVLDGSTVSNTGTNGLIDATLTTVTNGVEAVNIDVNVGDTQAGSEIITGVLVDLDDDTSSQTSTIRGYSAISTDVTGEASTVVQGFYSSGCDAAAQFDNGYVRIGTGATPGITPGDDDLFVEGTGEFDGELQADGSIDANSTIVGTGDNVTTISGMTSITENYAGADNVIAIAESGSTFTNSGDADGSLHTLPEASTCIGSEFTFMVVAAQTLTVNPDDADIIMHLTLSAGDAISSGTANDSIVLRAISASQWMVVSAYPTAADWADAN